MGADASNRSVGVVGHSVEATELQSQFDVKPDQFMVVLIGKDGSPKLKESVVEPAPLFQKIHAMPMRRERARRQDPL